MALSKMGGFKSTQSYVKLHRNSEMAPLGSARLAPSLLSFQLATETSISRTNSLSWNPRAVMVPWQLESIESSLRLLFQHMEDINTVNINKLQITFHNLYRTSKGVSTFQAAQICRAPLGAK